MDLETTAIVMAAAAALAALALWGARRKRPLGQVSLVPWHSLLFVALVGFCVFAAHLVALVTGVDMRPRGLP